VIQVASRALRLISYGYVFYAWGMVTMQAFNGAGDTYTPTLISIATNWVLQMPLAWILAFKTHLGPDGVFLTVALAASIYAVVAVILFRGGRWKRQRV
jgi:Na+-driven multidrug efflux pump